MDGKINHKKELLKLIILELALFFIVFFLKKLVEVYINFFNGVLQPESGYFVVFDLNGILEFGIQYIMFLLPFLYIAKLLIHKYKTLPASRANTKKRIVGSIVAITILLLLITYFGTEFVYAFGFEEIASKLNDFQYTKDKVLTFYKLIKNCSVILYVLVISYIPLQLLKLKK